MFGCKAEVAAIAGTRRDVGSGDDCSACHLWSGHSSESSERGCLPRQRSTAAREVHSGHPGKDQNFGNIDADDTCSPCRTSPSAERWCDLVICNAEICPWKDAQRVPIEPSIGVAALASRLLALAPPGSQLFIECAAVGGALVEPEDLTDEDLPAEGNLRAKAEPPPGDWVDQAALERMVRHWMQCSDDAVGAEEGAVVAASEESGANWAGGGPSGAAAVSGVYDEHISGHVSLNAVSESGSQHSNTCSPTWPRILDSHFTPCCTY